MISVVCWLWGEKYKPEHVDILRSMVHRNYPAPHRFICCTNNPTGIANDVEIVADRQDFADIPSPHANGAPSCYRRLALFKPDAAETFGERIVNLDLDTVITGDLRPLWDRPEDFVMWQDPMYAKQGNGSMMLLRAGSRPRVWGGFDPDRSPQIARAAGFMGSDQGFISHTLFADPRWTRADGVYSYRIDCKGGLPTDARAVFFHGNRKPWDCAEPWIKEAYQ